MDFFTVGVREIERGPNKGMFEIYPDFIVGRSQDLMVRGQAFYAVWDEEAGLWSTDEYAVQRLVDAELTAYAERAKADGQEVVVRRMKSFGSNGWSTFRKFVKNISDNYHELDSELTFANTDVKKTDYVSRRLPYPLAPGDHSAWDEIVSTLYEPEERAKIEWIIGAIVSGDSKKIQKFGVFYGPPGSGKGTILDVVERLFAGYTTSFEAKQLGSSGAQFATEVFRTNPLVAIQGDGDLSKIEDNARLNSIISHENMTMNEKFKSSYTARIIAFLLMGTNKPVKISDAKSGIIRRLIDIHPSGNKIPPNHYHTLMSQTDFELGAIAHHCLEVYRSMGKNYYNGYRPTEMMLQTDVFFNFIEAHFGIFKDQDGATLRQGYTLYKEFCQETGIDFVLPQHKFRDEFRNYFDHFHDRITISGEQYRSYYSGFNAEKFKAPAVDDDVTIFSLVMDETVSLLDLELAEWPAQPARIGPDGGEIPSQRWINVKTTLAEIDTNEVHYVKVPENHIVIDFDLQDENGAKSLERNLAEASKWPATYAELSKGGNGVHLHYIYDGDVTELASLYEPGVEIKTLLGDASLRRRLSKCNNVPIATINSGLPFKEKKPVLEDRQIKSEKGLRELIQRNLRKEIHPGTKPSIDFIKKILDDAYDSGMQYNVEDLKPKLISFANSSTHQPLVALKIVLSMKFKSEEDIKSVDITNTDERLVVYDVEVYPNLFVVCWKYAGAPKSSIVRMINPTSQDMEQLMKMRLVGFFNRNYDNHIIYARFLGYDNERLYQLSKKLIEGSVGAKFGEAYNISYADIYEFASIKMSLKKWQIELGIHHQELDIPWDEPVPHELWDKVLDYCCNDVESTDAVLKDREPDLVARKILAELSGLSVNDTTQKHTATIIFGKDRNPQSRFVYTDLSEEFPGYKFDKFATGQKSFYRGEDPSEGGYVYAEPGMYENVVVLDVASMHPSSLIALNAFGPYTPKFADLLYARLAIKHGDFEAARTMLDGRLAPYLENEADADRLSYALKIVINIVYGMTSAKFDNAFRDPKNIDNIVAKRGALFMIDLKNFVQEQGYQVVHIKTDSIKIPNATPEIIDQIMRFGEKYGYTFEHEATYDKFCLVNDAVYIARYGWAEKAKKIGTWDATGAQFQHPYVYKSLFSNEPLEWKDYCEAKSVQKGTMYLDFDGKRQFVGKTGLFVPTTKASGGGNLYRVTEEKDFAVAGTKGHLWMEADNAASGDVEIDISHFENLANQARKAVEKYGSYEEFVKPAA